MGFFFFWCVIINRQRTHHNNHIQTLIAVVHESGYGTEGALPSGTGLQSTQAEDNLGGTGTAIGHSNPENSDATGTQLVCWPYFVMRSGVIFGVL